MDELPVADTTTEPKVYSAPAGLPLYNPELGNTLIALPSQYKGIVDGQNSGSFTTRNKWSDFGRRMALYN